MDDSTFLDLVDLCYGTVEHPGQWDHLTTVLTTSLGAQAGDIVIEDYASGTARALGSVGFDPDYRDSYDTQFLGENTWINALERLPRGRVHEDQDEPPDFENSTYYNEWVRPQGFRHAMGAILERDQTWLIHIGFLRAPVAGRFARDDVALLDRLLPHLRRAIDFSERLRTVEQADTRAVALLDLLPFAAMVVDHRGRVQTLNAAAEALLSAGAVLRLGRDGLHAASARITRGLRQMIAAASTIDATAATAPVGALSLPRGDGDALLVEVLPLGEVDVLGGMARHCLVTVTDPAQALHGGTAQLQCLWGLTATEAQLALALANGQTVDDFSEMRAISPGTARWHLKNAEAKIGVGSIAALVQRVHGALRLS